MNLIFMWHLEINSHLVRTFNFALNVCVGGSAQLVSTYAKVVTFLFLQETRIVCETFNRD